MAEIAALEQRSTDFLPFGTEFKTFNFAAMAEAVGMRTLEMAKSFTV